MNIINRGEKRATMHYNFSSILNNDEELYELFIDKYVNHLNKYENTDTLLLVSKYYKQIYDTLNQDFTLEDLLSLFQELAKYKISHDIPYLILLSEISGFKNLFLEKIFHQKHNERNIKDVLSLFKEIKEKIAYIYLMEYLKKVIISNTIRLRSIRDILEADFIHHYEEHLIWLSNLAVHIQEQNKDEFVELDHTLCNFGKWLNSDAKNIIKDNSKYNTIVKLHKNLHLFAKKIYRYLNNKEYHIFISYLERCEFISLSLGTELALIDNTQMNQQIKKDELTGALNRNSLNGVFEHQYELTLATNNSFVVAMCDLDFFKKVNDTYGHVAGDKVLAHFVSIVKKHIRNSDIIIRYGGEEFIILLSSINKENGVTVLESIREDLQNSAVDYEKKSINITVSMGIMEIRPEKLFKHSFIDKYVNIVDEKLYTAKHNGRNRIEVE